VDEIEGLRYTVKEGDTLYGILSRAYGKANQALIDSVAVASDLDDPSRLSPGMVLVLPQVPGFDAPKRP
jgi:nucleoid-associated protein YgaU